MVEQGLAAALVIGLLLAALGWLRRRQGLVLALRRGRRRSLESLDQLRLTPQHSLHLVRVENRAMVVAVGASGCRVLARVAWPPGAETAAAEGGS